MKKVLFLALLFAASCAKQPNEADPNASDYFIFGIYYGECSGNCAVLFKLQGDQLYADENVTYLFPVAALAFQNQSLAADKVALAQNLYQNIPASLWNEKDGTIGCPDCRDQGGYYIKVSTDGKVREWFLDRDVAQYAAFCDSVSATVYKLQ